MTRTYDPMLARITKEPFSDEDWLFEIKWDGFRAIAYVNHELSLRSRKQKELKYTFPELRELVNLSHDVVLDGEIVAMKEGKPDFQALLERSQAASPIEIELHAKHSPIVYVVFDILEKDGVSLVDLPLIERKRILKDSLNEGNYVLFSDYVENNGEAYYTAALEKGLEGVMAKKKCSRYEQGIKSGNWLKIKRLRSCDCVIFGYTKGSGARSETFGAVLLCLYDGGKPVYVGKVGTGFSRATLEKLFEIFKQLKTGKVPFEIEIPDEITWLKPEIVCEVAYQAVTHALRLRMPRFLGLREDKLPSECTLDQILQGKLQEYRFKRDFDVTAEPTGGEERDVGRVFVVQEHHSRRLHYDLRLEKDGVLKSWAVPKGMPENPSEKHLAVETEDHPLGYASFEGMIPKGQYGAGTVNIWDKGVYEAKVWNEKMIEFTLWGQKLKGRYVLVRLKKAGEKSWLLLKGKE